MSRGPGHVMVTTLFALWGLEEEQFAEEDQFADRITYEALACGVYEVDQPTRAQVSAVARAAHRLAEEGLVQISIDGRDSRRKVIRAAPFVPLAIRLGASGDTTTHTSFVRGVQQIHVLLQELHMTGFISLNRGVLEIVPGAADYLRRGGTGPLRLSPQADELLGLLVRALAAKEAIASGTAPVLTDR